MRIYVFRYNFVFATKIVSSSQKPQSGHETQLRKIVLSTRFAKHLQSIEGVVFPSPVLQAYAREIYQLHLAKTRSAD
jgi:hypothetical protein